MSRVYNFGAGPACLPEEVLKKVQSELMEYGDTGMSVMELSHRSKDFEKILHDAESTLRRLLDIPSSYTVLFLQGGASLQFAAVPMNLMKSRVADYIDTGNWSHKALEEGGNYGSIHVVASSRDEDYAYIPDISDLDISSDADYVYICQNNTIYGTRYPYLPDTKGHDLVADVSSMFVSESMDVTRYGVIYAGVQKNAGPAGLVVLIVRNDLIRDDVLPGTPTMLKWKTQAKAGSLYNTPNCWAIYVTGLIFKWIEDFGGLKAMGAANNKKAALLYDYLDHSKLFKGTARKDSRSIMNVPFVTGDKKMDEEFISFCGENGIQNIRGHRNVGGMRASIYNAMPLAGVEALVDVMEKFEKGKPLSAV